MDGYVLFVFLHPQPRTSIRCPLCVYVVAPRSSFLERFEVSRRARAGGTAAWVYHMRRGESTTDSWTLWGRHRYYMYDERLDLFYKK